MPRSLDTAPVTDVRCPLGCTSATHRIVDTVWEAPEAAVYECEECSIVFVHPMMDEREEQSFYESEFTGYMKHRGAPGGTDPPGHFEANQGEGRRRAANLKPFLHPRMRVLELGSATGFLLDALDGDVGSVTGVEPGTDYRAYANERGIRTVADLGDIEHERFDLVLAYYVVEHLRDPVRSLGRLYELLDNGGLLAVEVPNVEDALVSFYQVAAFDRFYWQKAHYFNYSRRTLAMVLERAGFGSVELIPEQRYDISNHVHWLTKGEPGGKGKYTHVFDERLNSEYARVLKKHWLCDTVFAVATKGEPVGTRRPPSGVATLAHVTRLPEPGEERAGFVRLDRNERVGSLPEAIVDEIRSSIGSDLLTGYPVAGALHRELAESLGVEPAQLLLTPGSDAGTKAVFHSFVAPGDGVVILEPSYAMYRVYGQIFSADLRPVEFEPGLRLDEDKLLAAVGPGVRLVLVANPNQPTGTLLGENFLLGLAAKAADVRAVLAVDEAYYPFSGSTVLPRVRETPNLVVLRTMSKTGLAGLRIGYVVAHEALVSELVKVRSVHDVNAAAILAARTLLAHPEVAEEYVADVAAGAALLAERARAFGLEPQPVHANFMIVRLRAGIDPADLAARLRDRGYLVRSGFRAACLADCIRVTLGPPALMAGFADALEEAIPT